MSNQQDGILNTPDFGDEIAFTVGMSYLSGFILGIGRGTYRGMPKSWKIPRKILWNNFFNSIGTQTSRIANAFAGAGFLYFGVGKVLGVLLEDQLDEVSPLQKNMICGAATGALFKSTLGVVPSLFGCVLGAGISAGVHTIIDHGNRSGLIGF